MKRYKSIIEQESKDIIITLPKNIKWGDYEKELEKAKNGEIMNFKVSNFPKTKKGNKCYICHDGYIKGYMIIYGLEEKDFICTTTGKHWKGKFIQRTGDFYKINPVPYKGFQGFRYYNGDNE